MMVGFRKPGNTKTEVGLISWRTFSAEKGAALRRETILLQAAVGIVGSGALTIGRSREGIMHFV